MDVQRDVRHLFTYFKKALDSVTREMLYTALNKFNLPLKQVRLIKMCLKEIYSEMFTGKRLSPSFPV
jgi:hypothetical protein